MSHRPGPRQGLPEVEEAAEQSPGAPRQRPQVRRRRRRGVERGDADHAHKAQQRLRLGTQQRLERTHASAALLHMAAQALYLA